MAPSTKRMSKIVFAVKDVAPGCLAVRLDASSLGASLAGHAGGM